MMLFWAGDINVDFIRDTRNVKRLESFIDNTMLNKSWDSYRLIIHMNMKMKISHTCTIDHFFGMEA